MATLKDVARAANVSTATVCRVLNFDNSISITTETRAKIFKAARELEYKTKSERKGGKPSRTLRVGIVQMEYVENGGEDLYYLMMMSAVQKECYRRNIESIVLFHDDNDGHLVFHGNAMLDGIISIGKLFSEQEFEEMEKLSSNIVLVDNYDDSGKYYCIYPNQNNIRRIAMDTIINNNHKLVCYLAPFDIINETLFVIGKEVDGLAKIIDDNGIEIIRISCGYDAGDAYEKLDSFLKTCDRVPTFYLLHTGVISSGVVKALNENGLSIPRDASVLAATNTPDNETLVPPLSSIKVYYMSAAVEAVRCVREGTKPSAIRKDIAIAASLVDRGSIGKI